MNVRTILVTLLILAAITGCTTPLPTAPSLSTAAPASTVAPTPTPTAIPAITPTHRPQSAGDGVVNGWAVLAEKDDYSDVGMTDLLVDYINVTRLRQLLLDLGWKEERVRELREFDQEDLRQALDWLATSADEDDVVFFYVTAHGKFLREVVRWGDFFVAGWVEVPSQRRVLLVDSCQAALLTAAVNSDSRPHLSIAAVDEDEYGWAGLEEEGLPIIGGVFTHYFAAAFGDPEADTDGDGLISAQEAALMAEEQQRAYMHDVVFAVPEFVESYHDIGVFPDQDPTFPSVVVDDTIGDPLYLALDAYPTATVTTTPSPTIDAGRADGLSEEEAATLGSLEQVDDYPLYAMHYYGAYNQRVSSFHGDRWLASVDLLNPSPVASSPAWACSLFAALGDADEMFYGRNFDWEYSPAVLLFTDPPDGYASVSMVDIAYLGFGGDRAGTLTGLPLAERRSLLDAPFWPFDGMNEHGLAVGMAAVPPGQMHPDPDKETIGSLRVIREMLDHAGNVDEAVAIFHNYNVDMEGGPPIHYLIADSSGRSVLVEFYQGEMVIIPSQTAWHLATNFLRASAGTSAEGPVLSEVEGECWRYDRISQRLIEAQGRMTAQDAVDLLAEVSQENTQWSVVYGMSNGDIHVTMGREYGDLHIFQQMRE